MEYITSFDCAHIIAEANGGQTILDNLKITCKTCNLSCGTENLDVFKAKFASVNKIEPLETAETEFNKSSEYKHELIQKYSKHDTNQAVSVLRRYQTIAKVFEIWKRWYSLYQRMNKEGDKIWITGEWHINQLNFQILRNGCLSVNDIA